MSDKHWQNFVVQGSDPLSKARYLGGKAQNLYYMTAIGMPVPKWVCLSTVGFNYFVGAIGQNINEIFQSLQMDDLGSFDKAAKQIHSLIDGIKIDPEVLDEILSNFDDDQLLAVRSSATAEDGASFSFAGQLESYLFVDHKELEIYIKSCWSSGYSARILQYMKLHRIDLSSFKVAVIFQEMIHAKKSGVLFTINPLATENFTKQVVITAGFGLGEGIVRDLVETDTYVFDQQIQKIVDTNYSKKYKQLVFDEKKGKGIIEIDVPSNLSNASVLTQGQIEKLVGIGKQIRRFHACEQDIEWAIDSDGKIFITQCRPVTSIGKNLGGVDFYLDNSNIVESFPGINTPWTISQVREVYARIFADTARRLGISKNKIDKNRIIFDHLIATHQGRMYYNLTHWYAMMRLVPYSESYIRVWEEMLGVGKNYLSNNKVGDVFFAKPWQLLKTSVLLVNNLIFLNLRLHFLDRHLNKVFQSFWIELKKGEFHGLKSHQLVDYLQLFKEKCFHRWELTLLNDIYAFLWTSISKKMISKWVDSDQVDKLFNDLLLGDNSMDSVLPIKSILNMANIVGKNPELEKHLRDMVAIGEVKAELLKNNNEELTFKHFFLEHIERFGDRGVEELKLETITFRENPVLLLTMVLDYIPTAMTIGHQSMEASKAAMEVIENKLSRRKIRKMLFCWVLKFARRSTNYRENFRLHRSRVYGIVRRLTLLLGKRLEEHGVIDSARDIFYLEQTDVAHFTYALSYEEDLKHKVKVNKAYYKKTKKLQAVSKYQFGKLKFCPISTKIGFDESIEVLHGLPCASGIVEAEAIVIHSPSDVLDTSVLKGKILVAPMTDPSWVFIMTLAKGLIVEKGSILSHTAIIGRELGIPTIVGTENATKAIRNGDKVRMNGSKGVIQVMSRVQDEESSSS